MKWFLGLLAASLTIPAMAADPRAVAAAIDRRIADKLAAANVPAAPLADDAAFFRRINLALAGRIPVPSAVRLFLADTDPDKRAKAVETLLASPAYANHLTTSWRGWMLPEAATDPQVAAAVPGFEAWLRTRIRADVPFDALVTELLTAPLGARPATARGADPDDPDAAGPLAFYAAKEGKPENLAAATARLFLGVHLECAQCHDHPFDKWNREQFWGLAAFFAGVEQQNGGLRERFDRRELTIPNADRAVPARFLDDQEPAWQFRKSPRVTLAKWLTARDNPFFARAVVNRVWGLLFGVGIVDPVDDFHDQNRPTHPDLLTDLAAAFAASGYDVKFVIRAIVLSDTFQRSSGLTHPGQKDVRLFARFPVVGLTPEQLFDSLAVAVGTSLEDGTRRQFLATFATSGRRTESPTTIIQALALMNGGLVGGATTLNSSRTLAAVMELPGLSPADRVEALYLAALGRPPRPEELKRALAYIAADGPGQARERYADVLWAVLNGIEFRTNH